MPAKKSEFTGTEIKAGFLVLLSGAIFAVFMASVLGYRPVPEGDIYYAEFPDMAGLRSGAEVRFGGLQVGRVVALEPSPEDRSKIRVTAMVNAGTPVNEASEAYVTQTTLTAEMHLEISTGSNDAALLESGATLASGSGGLFGAMEAAAEDVSVILEDVGVLLGVRDESGEPAMSPEEQQTLNELLAGLGGLVGDLQTLVGVTDADGEPTMTDEELKTAAEIFAELDGAVKEGGALLTDLQDTLEENRPALNETVEGAADLIADVDSFLEENRDDLAAAIDGLNGVMTDAQAMMADLQSLASNVDGFFENNEPVLEDILLDLRETLRNLETFSETLADQPQAIIRGRQPTGRQQ